MPEWTERCLIGDFRGFVWAVGGFFVYLRNTRVFLKKNERIKN